MLSTGRLCGWGCNGLSAEYGVIYLSGRRRWKQIGSAIWRFGMIRELERT